VRDKSLLPKDKHLSTIGQDTLIYPKVFSTAPGSIHLMLSLTADFDSSKRKTIEDGT
jgi:hypothetical protein